MSYIKLEQVGKEVKSRLLLHDVNAEIEQNSITVLEGINGSGKTLVLKAILGLIRTTGQIFVNDQQVKVEEPYPVKAGILIENPSLIENFTAYQNMDLLAKLDKNIQDEQIIELLSYFDLDKFPKQKVKKFSLGMKQKLGIAQALLGKYPLIVLDEPTNALDEKSVAKLIDIIKKYNSTGSTFIIASHDRDFIEQVATKQLIIKEGTIINEKQEN
ncbi:ATP-binding cassette domain-containing protein [Lactobacillus sp. ESL0731]|uniref:ATP-binding cassette domain-containing protein n=1 Tax=unclassified Lactobacillus TaxID=2620435 RepID=UPI0023F73055|nr:MULTISPECIES: ATP-binding cassette domain-containing protein [unclassified Lactobacillus]WEV50618.1 ATP-binding cassette domain-containing protein [Lactobacillus sp. ESL0700]WEV61748.1 ATP-binding cassette domain-containing protein [Lactobacillus sp. ESL0731]